MRVQFVRSGGFTGLRLAATIDSASLPEEEARALEMELEQAHFFDLPARLSSRTGGVDQFQYELTVEWSGKIHHVEAGETAIPADMQPLVRHLELLARSHRAPG